MNINISIGLGNGKQVYGELYEVDEKVFADLDILEDHPNFYEREQIECQCLSDNNVIKAWMYFIKKFKPSLLNNTNYESYSNNGEHGLKYVDRYLRIKGYNHKSDVLMD